MGLLEEIKRDFSKWRRERQGTAEPIPESLRRRVVELIRTGTPRAVLRDELHLNYGQFALWSEQCLGEKPSASPEENSPMTVVHVSDGSLRRELERLRTGGASREEPSQAPQAVLEHESGWRMTLWGVEPKLVEAFVEAVGGRHASARER